MYLSLGMHRARVTISKIVTPPDLSINSHATIYTLMKRSIATPPWCPVARSLDRLGDTWSMLILRDAFYGLTKFDEFEQSLGVAPNVLSARLKALVAHGLLERRQYSARPPRFDYVLTPAGQDARSVSLALLAWGNRHLAPEGESIVVVNTETGESADPVMVDRKTGRPLTDPAFRLAAGPAAPEAARCRVELGREWSTHPD